MSPDADHCPTCGTAIQGIVPLRDAGVDGHAFEPCGHPVPDDFTLAHADVMPA